jgi:hypothetical protein
MKRLSLPLLATLALLGAAAQAQVYSDGTVGIGQVNGSCRGQTPCDASTTDARISIGYQFNERLGVELSWLDLGRVRGGDDATGMTTKFHGIAVGPAYRYPLAPKLDLNLRAGLAWNRVTDTSWKAAAPAVTLRQRSVQPYAGIGATYLVGRDFSLGLGLDLTRARIQDRTSLLRSINLVVRQDF